MNVAEYERMYQLEDSYWWFVGRHLLVDKLLDQYYDARTDLTVLDVGCGTGAMSARLQKRGRVVSADFSSLALQFSRRRGLSGLAQIDAMNLGLAADSFDLITAMDMLEHLPDDHAAVCEFFRVLKPGGLVVAMVPAYKHLWSEHDTALMHFRRYTRAEMADLFLKRGFRLKRVSHTMTTLYPFVALQRRLKAASPPHDPPRAFMPVFPPVINMLLTGLMRCENAISSRINLPFGSTVLCVAEKPTTNG